MKIVALRLYHLSAKLPETIGNALIFFDRRETLLFELVGEDGQSGWGESWPAPTPTAALIATQLAPCVLGQDCEHIGRLWQAMSQAASAEPHGIAAMAVAAIDMALHDLTARGRGIPLSTLLGGAARDRVLAYASGPFFKPGGHPYRHFAVETEGYLRAGFRAIKLRSGFNPVDDAAAAIDVRRRMGPKLGLMIDFNESYTPRAAVAAVSRMAEADLLWVEEPAVPGDLEGYRQIAHHIMPAIAGGETFGGAKAFRRFLELGCMDVLQPDIAICGGLTGVQRVVALAEIFDRPVVPHVWGSTVNFHAALHLAATLPSHRSGGPGPFPLLEYDAGPNPLLDLAGHPALNPDGTVTVPDGPGLGITLTPDMLAPFVERRWEWLR